MSLNLTHGAGAVAFSLADDGRIEIVFPGPGRGSRKVLTLKQAETLASVPDFTGSLSEFLASTVDIMEDAKIVFDADIAKIMSEPDVLEYVKDKEWGTFGHRRYAMKIYNQRKKAVEKASAKVEIDRSSPEQQARVDAARERLASM